MKIIKTLSKNKIIAFTTVIVAVVLISFLKEKEIVVPPAPEKTEADIVQDVVENFGNKLKLVSVLAPKEILTKAISGHYSPYVASTLVLKWQKNLKEAPGREVSSPWPDHIEVDSVVKNEDGSYTVKGRVIEKTTDSSVNGGIANEYPVVATLKSFSGKWLITEYKKEVVSVE